MTEDERAIRELIDAWFAASKAGDYATILGLMTEDAVFLAPGAKPFGREAFAAAAKNASSVRLEGNYEIEELEVLDDWAYLRSYIEIAAIPAFGQPVRRSGHTLTLLRKEADGRWRLARDANLLIGEKTR
jgi:uncharacterized protein (TIGR02246 family)